jgi:hypothetical protein
MRTPHRPGTTTVAGLDAVLWLRFEETDGRLVGCRAHGTRRRRPVEVRITVAAGLALAEAGVPTVVCAEPARAKAV